MYPRLRPFVSAIFVVLGSPGAASLSGCGETKRVFVEYSSQAELFEELAKGSADSPIRVCVAKIDVNWRVDDPATLRSSVQSHSAWTYTDLSGRTSQGNTQTDASVETERVQGGRLWSNAVRSRIGDLLASQAAAAGVNLVLVDRDRLKTYLDEKDLALADIVEGDRLLDKAKVLPIDLFIFGTIEGQTVIRAKMETNSALNIARFSPYGGNIAAAMNCPKQRIQRTVTFSGCLALHENATGRILLSHALTGQTIEDERAKPWQSDRTEMDLMPEEQQIKGKLDGEVRRFVGRLLPTPIEMLYTVKSSRSKESKEAVKRLAVGADEEALALFRDALRKAPGDHRSAFGAGVACERLERLAEAESYYRQAVMNSSGKKDKKGNGESQYLLALQRIKDRLAPPNALPGQSRGKTVAQSR